MPKSKSPVRSKSNSARPAEIPSSTRPDIPDEDIVNDSMAGEVNKSHGIKGRKRKLLLPVSILVITILSGVVFYMLTHTARKPVHTDDTAKVLAMPPKPRTQPSPLTGRSVSSDRAEHPVVSVIIENLYPAARPQSGLSSAGIVYEALAEGGITRYQAFFGDTMPPDIGPIRSIRTYFLRWGLEYDSPVVHAGGNADALDLISPLGMKNLDQFANGNYFRRIPTRYAPHNLYTTGDQLDNLMRAKGYYTKPKFAAWPRKDDAKSTAPTASTITVDPSYYDYQIVFRFDPSDNSYVRSIRGVVDMDANGNVPIKPKNVVVLKVPTSYGLTRTGEQTVIMNTVGTGSGVMFEDGLATEITWSKASDSSQTIFKDLNGNSAKFNRGQTWVTVIPTIKTVTYQ